MAKKERIDTAADAIVGARKIRTVTPHPTDALPDGACDSLYINDNAVVSVEVLAEDDTTGSGGYHIMWIAGPGELAVRAKAVKNGAGTTATDIKALY